MNKQHDYRPLKIGRLGGSKYVLLPSDFTKANELKHGDSVLFDFSTARIIRAKDMPRLAEPVVEAAE